MSRRGDELERQVKRAIETLEHLLAPSAGKGTKTVLAEMLRRAEQPSQVDGYAPTSALEPSGVHGSSDLTSVEAAANSRMADKCPRCDGTMEVKGRKCRVCNGTGRRWADPIGADVGVIVNELGVLFRSSQTIGAKTDSVMGSAMKLIGRQSSLQGNCAIPACSASVSGSGWDRLRSGYCKRCSLHFDSWRILHRSSDPGADRAAFAVYMADWLAAKAEKDRAKAEKESKEIERLRRRGELPTARAR